MASSHNYKASNKAKIISAFAKSYVNAHMAMQQGLERLLNLGVEYCLKNHDARHQRHLQVGDSYGWLLMHNGEEIKRRIYAEGAEAEGNASSSLDWVKGIMPQDGYVGIILAGVDPPEYFQVLYEFVPMRQAIKDIKAEDFNRYFKKL